MIRDIAECRTVGEMISWGEVELDGANLWFGHGTDSAWDESVAMVFWSLGIDRFASHEVLQQTLGESDRTKIAHLFRRRITDRLPGWILRTLARTRWK